VTGAPVAGCVVVSINAIASASGIQIAAGILRRMHVREGDLNGNGRVTSADINLLKEQLGPVTNPIFRSDLDGDGVVDMIDVSRAKGITDARSTQCP
jgi:hypothetical protein